MSLVVLSNTNVETVKTTSTQPFYAPPFDEIEDLKMIISSQKAASVGWKLLKGDKLMVSVKKQSELTKKETYKGLDTTDPERADVEFTVAKFTVYEKLQLEDMFADISYVEGKDGKTVIQRQFPKGTGDLRSVELGLKSWNLCDDNQNPIAVNATNIVQYLTDPEFQGLVKKITELNPVVEDSKNAS